MGLVKNLLVGGKAIIGSIVAGIISWLVTIIAAFFVGTNVQGLMTRPNLVIVLFLIIITINIYILGWIYNSFWGWN